MLLFINKFLVFEIFFQLFWSYYVFYYRDGRQEFYRARYFVGDEVRVFLRRFSNFVIKNVEFLEGTSIDQG